MGTKKKAEHIESAEAKVAASKMKSPVPLQDVPTYYTNLASIRTSLHDVQVIHCQTVAPEGDEMLAIPQAVVYMSHVHAKRMASLILKQVEEFEEKFGKLPEG